MCHILGKQVQEANSQLYRRQKEAEAAFFESEKKEEAQKASADAELYTRQQAANSELYAKQKEAEGIAAIGKAQSIYSGSILKELNHNYSALRDYLMINNGIYQEIANINAQAVNGMQPKISIWSGANGGEGRQRIEGCCGGVPHAASSASNCTGANWDAPSSLAWDFA